MRDGDGWVECAQGHRHWGRFGAAGLLLHRPSHAGPGERGTGSSAGAVLLQHRAAWSHHGGTWGLLGGARHSDEATVTAALREAGEEGGLDAAAVKVHGEYVDAHGGWSYATALARTAGDVPARPTGAESIDVTWVEVDDVEALPLHPGFAESWPLLRPALFPLRVVVDAANVVGSRPDGWWRDRAGATRRLIGRCERLVTTGVVTEGLPGGLDLPVSARWWPAVTVVVEGAARPALDAAGPVAVHVAAGSGDDAIVDLVTAAMEGILVVTADRHLRDRVRAAGATVIGPRWLNDLLDDLHSDLIEETAR